MQLAIGASSGYVRRDLSEFLCCDPRALVIAIHGRSVAEGPNEPPGRNISATLLEQAASNPPTFTQRCARREYSSKRLKSGTDASQLLSGRRREPVQRA